MQIYLDASVALAQIMLEAVVPPVSLWKEPLTSSRLVQYEVWTTLHRRGFGASHADLARELIDRLDLVELTPVVLGRTLEPFPHPLRTLDALHLATVEFLKAEGRRVQLATYDRRLRTAARKLDIPLYRL